MTFGHSASAGLFLCVMLSEIIRFPSYMSRGNSFKISPYDRDRDFAD